MTEKTPEKCISVDEVRNQIDRLDKEIISLFSERHKYIEKIVQFKNDEVGIVALNRKEKVINERASWAEDHGLNGDVFQKIYTLLVESNIKRELEIFNSKTKK